MEQRKIGWVAATAVTLILAVNTAAASAQDAKAGIIIANGTGAEITELILTPSRSQYSNNRNCFALQGMELNDKEVLGVTVPEHFIRFKSFDIEVKSGGKRYVTNKGVTLDLNSGSAPVLELSETGKDSSLGLKGAVIGAAGSVVFMTYTPAGKELTKAIILAFPRFHTIGALLAVPVAAGTAGYFIGKALASRGLDVNVIY
jgi:hypothetical protein